MAKEEEARIEILEEKLTQLQDDIGTVKKGMVKVQILEQGMAAILEKLEAMTVDNQKNTHHSASTSKQKMPMGGSRGGSPSFVAGGGGSDNPWTAEIRTRRVEMPTSDSEDPSGCEGVEIHRESERRGRVWRRQSEMSVFDGSFNSGENHRRCFRPPRLSEMSGFHGGDPDEWIFRAERYFSLNRLSEMEKIEATALSFDGEARAWFQQEDWRRPVRSWEEMKALLLSRFRSSQEDTRNDPMKEKNLDEDEWEKEPAELTADPEDDDKSDNDDLSEENGTYDNGHPSEAYDHKCLIAIHAGKPKVRLKEGTFLNGLKPEIRAEELLLQPIGLVRPMNVTQRSVNRQSVRQQQQGQQQGNFGKNLQRQQQYNVNQHQNPHYQNYRRGISDLGVQELHLEGDEYVAVVDEFMEAVVTCWPHVMVQFDDFQSKWAFKLLQRYRNTYRMFNDDVQGIAGVPIASLLSAVRAQGRPMIGFPKLKIVVTGAGSAGIGVLNAARKTMARRLGNNQTDFDSVSRQFWVVDTKGLITEEHENIDPETFPFARKAKEVGPQGLAEGASLAEVVRQVKPDVLLRLSAVGKLFSKEVLEAMKGSTSTRPAIFAMSNPTKNAECTPEEAFFIFDDNIIFASGRPFKDVDLGNGHIGHCNQGNNMYPFPGIGLGALLSSSWIISDGMFQAAAECLATYMTDNEVLNGKIYPSISSIQDITKEVAAAYFQKMIDAGLRPNLGVYNRLVDQLVKVGKIDEVKSFFDIIVKELKMNNESYKCMMKALSEVGRLDEMLKIVDIILDDDETEIDEELQEFVRGELGKEGQEEDLVKLMEEKEGQKTELKAKEAEAVEAARKSAN